MTERTYEVGEHVTFTDDNGERRGGEITDVFAGPVTREPVYVIDGNGYYGSGLAPALHPLGATLHNRLTREVSALRQMVADHAAQADNAVSELRDDLCALAERFDRHQSKALPPGAVWTK